MGLVPFACAETCTGALIVLPSAGEYPPRWNSPLQPWIRHPCSPRAATGAVAWLAKMIFFGIWNGKQNGKTPTNLGPSGYLGRHNPGAWRLTGTGLSSGQHFSSHSASGRYSGFLADSLLDGLALTSLSVLTAKLSTWIPHRRGKSWVCGGAPSSAWKRGPLGRRRIHSREVASATDFARKIRWSRSPSKAALL